MIAEHKWTVDYEPVVDAPVVAGSGAKTPKEGDVGENRSGIGVVITNGPRRVEVARIGFAPHLRRRSGLERKLREIEDEIAQPACDALNRAQQRVAEARTEGEAAIEKARADHAARVAAATAALREVEREVVKPWDRVLV